MAMYHHAGSPAAYSGGCRPEWVRQQPRKQADQAAMGVYLRKGGIVIAPSAALRAGEVCVVRKLGYWKGNKEKHLLRPL